MSKTSEDLIIHHLGVSQSDRIVWLMEELELPYTLKWHDRGPDGLMPAEYRDLHPAGTAPVIEDDGKVLTESVVIVEYICRRYADGRLLVAPDTPNYYDYLFAMQLNNNLLGLFFAKRAVQLSAPDNAEGVVGFYDRREQRYFAYIDGLLGQHDYLAGDEFTCADVMTMFALSFLVRFGGGSLDAFPNLAAYVERIAARPAYVKAMAIAGPTAKRP